MRSYLGYQVVIEGTGGFGKKQTVLSFQTPTAKRGKPHEKLVKACRLAVAMHLQAVFGERVAQLFADLRGPFHVFEHLDLWIAKCVGQIKGSYFKALNRDLPGSKRMMYLRQAISTGLVLISFIMGMILIEIC